VVPDEEAHRLGLFRAGGVSPPEHGRFGSAGEVEQAREHDSAGRESLLDEVAQSAIGVGAAEDEAAQVLDLGGGPVADSRLRRFGRGPGRVRVGGGRDRSGRRRRRDHPERCARRCVAGAAS
jgi:hypothetical protein